MFEMLFAGLGIKPEQIKEMGEEFIRNSQETRDTMQQIEMRLNRIENALNIRAGENDDRSTGN